MNIYILGLPKSGRSSLSKALANFLNFHHIDATSWLRQTFRDQRIDEHNHQYNDDFHKSVLNKLKDDPQCVLNKIKFDINSLSNCKSFIIDGLFSPVDFTNLFNPKTDMVIFLNCTNNVSEYRDYESVGVSVIRDFCFWLSAAGLLDDTRWLEYNFSIPGISDGVVKKLSHKNTVFITKSLDKTISHVIDYISPLIP